MSPNATPAAATAAKKAVATVALVELEDASAAILRDCFKQFGIQTAPLAGDVAQRLQRQKFEAMALRLNDSAQAVLQAARTSPSNRRVVVYGISSVTKDTLRFSKYCINAVLQEPLERQATLKVVRATRLLVINELRIYVRVPILLELNLDSEGRRFKASTQEVSAGGMSLNAEQKLKVGQVLDVSFTLPDGQQVRVGASVCWLRNPDLVGIRFEPSDERRLAVRHWIDDYLGIS
ncbi:MAG: PilZ domain-containing protein [Acidobacteria bacterium]|nr:PilZ domain-containing protein [Acidobacteriota bacterium]